MFFLYLWVAAMRFVVVLVSLPVLSRMGHDFNWKEGRS
jgi:hypothetical protein